MFFELFENIESKDKSEAVERLIEDSSPRRDFFLMVMLSVSMATFGILLDSVVVLIGSIMIAPVLYPVLSISMGLVMVDSKLIARSFYTLLKSVLLALTISGIIGLFFPKDEISSLQLLKTISGSPPSFLFVMVAVIAGFAASFALVKPQLNETLPGVAIAVALVPPLTALGIGAVKLDWNIFSNSLLLFLSNIAGIIFSSMLVFSLLNLYVKRKIAAEAIKKEERLIKEEKEEGKK